MNRRLAALPVFLLIVFGGGLAIGLLVPPGEWYASLAKPPFNPPNWLFAPVWSVLYVLIAVAGWRVWRAAPRSRAFTAWVVQLVLNFLWTPVFFGAHRIALGLVVIAVLFLTILVFIAAARRLDLPAALLFVPYALWIAFACLLNLSLLFLNP
ncbi:MAG: tryptophan-rich sensory protein [Rhizobiales bacterium]|nr:tryptophan-rich sensory protein [Hyphomicrobiales bacterium]